jgi:hypothetical protein
VTDELLIGYLQDVYNYEEKDVVVMMDGVGDDHLEPNNENIVSRKALDTSTTWFDSSID